MTAPRMRFVAIALVLFLIIPGADAAKRRRGKSHSKRAVPAGPADAASGTTLSERITSLMNGSVARSSDVSLQVVDVDAGTVVAERNANVPLAPASNMKLFTTATAIDLLHPDFQVTTTVFMRGVADARKLRTSIGMSSTRSRRGGTRTLTFARR